MIINTDKLVNSRKLLELLFDEDCRPTIRWLQLRMKSRDIPYIKIGHSVFFDPTQVREALAARKTIRARRAQSLPKPTKSEIVTGGEQKRCS